MNSSMGVGGVDDYPSAGSSPDLSNMMNNNNNRGNMQSQQPGNPSSNGSSGSSFLANECLSYAFSVWRMEGAWSSSQADLSSWNCFVQHPSGRPASSWWIFQPISVSWYWNFLWSNRMKSIGGALGGLEAEEASGSGFCHCFSWRSSTRRREGTKTAAKV